MGRRAVLRLALLLALVGLVCISPAVAEEPPLVAQAQVGTAFTYQGRLLDGGISANGVYDLVFRLYDGADPAAATQVNPDVALEDVVVTDGLFTVQLDFGSNSFTGEERWLQVSVRPGASTGEYTALAPLTALTGTPYALGLRPGILVEAAIEAPILEVHNSGTTGAAAAIIGRATDDSGAAYGVVGSSSSPDGYGILGIGRSWFSDDVGIGGGTNPPTHRLHVAGTVSGSATIANHVALIENLSTGTSADVLALRIRTPHSAVGGANNFITFFDAGTNTLGSVQAVSGGTGVQFGSAGEDYAEWLPRLDESEAIEPGDIVGVFGGSVSKATVGADQLLAVSTAPIIAAGDPGEEQRAAYELVAFVGRVQVRVSGPVTAGDFVIPSGLGDGTGIAVSPEAITAEQFAQVVGQAWETASDPALKSVCVVVGLARRDPTIARLVQQAQAQEARLADIEARLAALESE